MATTFRDEAHQKAVKLRLKLEESAETLRLVYVALTRAVHRCVIVAGCYRTAGRYPSPTASTRSLLNWLVAGNGLTPQEWFEHKNGAAPISIGMARRWRSGRAARSASRCCRAAMAR